jgi:hypothetical protein
MKWIKLVSVILRFFDWINFEKLDHVDKKSHAFGHFFKFLFIRFINSLKKIDRLKISNLDFFKKWKITRFEELVQIHADSVC